MRHSANHEPGARNRAPRVWLLTNTPSPYQVEFFRALHASGRCELAVRFMRITHRGTAVLDESHLGFPCQALRAIGPARWRDEARFHPKALREVRRGPYDFFVLSGHYTSPTFIACALALARRRKPWAAWLEQPWPEDYRPAWSRSLAARNPVARRLREGVLRRLVRKAPRILCIGTAAQEAYRRRGAAEEKLVVLPYHCDLERYRTLDEKAADALREKLGLVGRFVFLFSGQMIERKGVDVLLKAFSALAEHEPDAALLLLGDGPLRATLEASVPGAVRARVVFAGPVPYESLPSYYRVADAFVFPSRHDGWGVVLNEACAAGLPIVTTRAVGASRDLVIEGQTGFVLERDDAEGFREKMAWLLRHRDEARRFGERGRALVQKYSLPRGVDLFLETARLAGPSYHSL